MLCVANMLTDSLSESYGRVLDSPLMPTEGAPAATAARAYSIWTSLPEGLQEEKTQQATLLCVKVK